MTDEDRIESAYEPPLADNEDRLSLDESPDAWPGLKAAGVLLLIATGGKIAFAIVDTLLGMTVTWMGAFVMIAAAGIGGGLCLRGKPFRLPTLAYLCFDVTLPLLNVLRAFGNVDPRYVLGSMVSRFYGVFPVVLLLIGRPSRRRIRSAVALFIVLETITTAAGIWRTYQMAPYVDRYRHR